MRIRLTENSGKVTMVETTNVCFFRPQTPGTQLVFPAGLTLEVRETIDQIEAKLDHVEPVKKGK